MKKIYLAFFVLFMICISCNDDDFLQQRPHGLTDYALYRDPEGALEGLNAAYSILQSGEEVGRVLLAGTVCSGDALAGGAPGGGDSPALPALMRFDIYPDNGFVNAFWAAMYRGIYRCNLIIGYMEDPGELSPHFDDILRQRILGEALFLRGFYHFQLQIRYGGFPQLQAAFGGKLKGVPFTDHIPAPEEWAQERPELDYTWKRIEEDFTRSSGLLPEKSGYASADMGRATRGAALAMLAKTHLFQEEWTEAYQAAKTVIESGEYWLEGGGNHTASYTVIRPIHGSDVPVEMSGYQWIWQPEANNSGGSVFDIQHRQEGSLRYPQGGQGNLVCGYYGPRAIHHGPFTKTFPDRTDGPASVELDASLDYFWGFILPTDYFVKTAFKAIACEIDGEIVDPRYQLSVVEREARLPVPSLTYTVSFTYDSGTVVNPVTWDTVIVRDFGDSMYYDSWNNWPTTGRCTRKYFTDPVYSASATTLADYPQNNKLIRFADVLLMGAEAATHIGQNGDALDWINRVRERARNAGNTGYPLNYTGTIAPEQVWAERRVELAFEGHQFFDIIRTGRAGQVLRDEALQEDFAIITHPVDGSVGRQQFGDRFETGKHEIWPIPSSETEGSGSNITQNPNY
jgi:hypothetical protein